MPEDQTRALAALSQAMAIEQEGIDFYSRAAKQSPDAGAAEVFRRLARDEENHLDLLRRQYDSLKSEGFWRELPEQRADSRPATRTPFPRMEEIPTEAPPPGSSPADALLFGLGVETRSYDLYSREASDTQDLRGKSMYRFLVAEETRHFELLMARYEQLTGPVGWQY